MANSYESRPGTGATPNDGNQFRQGAPQQGRAEDILHQQHVQKLRGFIAHAQKDTRAGSLAASPVQIIRSRLSIQSIPSKDGRSEFWKPILTAWDALAFDRYAPDSPDKTNAHLDLWQAFETTKYHPSRGPKVIITREQAAVLDALAEAADIPRPRGQTEIEIPERARTVSKERENSYNNMMRAFLLGPKKY